MGSNNVLPTETLLKIFSYLNCNDLEKCAAVCRSWCTAAREVSETKWEELCKNEFGEVYEVAYKKAHMSWENLYKSLESWSQVQNSEVYTKYSKLLETHYISAEDRASKRLQFLNDGTIGYAYFEPNEDERWMDDFTEEQSHWNIIHYYDAQSLKVIKSADYGFNFDVYKENDDIIVLRQSDDVEDVLKLYIVIKSNKTVHLLGDLYTGRSDEELRFHLVDNKVYYKTTDATLWMTKPVVENGLNTIHSSVIAPPDATGAIGCIYAISYVNDNFVKLLTKSGDILSVHNKKVTKLCNIETRNVNNVISVLKENGFFWNAPTVYDWMCSKSLAVTHLKGATVYSYFDKVVLVGTLQRVLHIYYNPYRNKQLKLFKAKPTLKIDLNGWIPTNGAWPRYVNDSQRKINEIEVVEIENGHRIILLYCQRLVAIELRLKAPKRSSSGQQLSVTIVGMQYGEYTRIL